MKTGHHWIRLPRKRSTCKQHSLFKQRRDTTKGCASCNVHLCSEPCFIVYHESQTQEDGGGGAENHTYEAPSVRSVQSVVLNQPRFHYLFATLAQIHFGHKNKRHDTLQLVYQESQTKKGGGPENNTYEAPSVRPVQSVALNQPWIGCN